MQAKQLALTACLLAAPILAQTNSTPAASPDLYHGLADKKKPENVEIVPGLKIGALIELEAEYVNQDGTDSSDAYVATMELGADFQPVEWAEGHVLFKWEEDSDKDVELDEATVTLGNTEDIHFHFRPVLHLPLASPILSAIRLPRTSAKHAQQPSWQVMKASS